MGLSNPSSIAWARYNISVLLCSSTAITIICIVITATRLHFPTSFIWVATFSPTLIIHAISFFYAAPCWLEVGTAALMTGVSFASVGIWGCISGTDVFSCATSDWCDAISTGANLFLWIFMTLHTLLWAAHACILALLARSSWRSRDFWMHAVVDVLLSSDPDNLVQDLFVESNPQPMASARSGRLRKGWTLEESMTQFMFDTRKNSRFQPIRGIVVLAFVLFLLWYIAEQMGEVIGNNYSPIRQTSYSTSRFMDDSQIAARHVDQINVFVGYQYSSQVSLTSAAMAAALNITALWPDKLPREIRKDCTPMSHASSSRILENYSSSFACPFAQMKKIAGLGLGPECSFQEYSPGGANSRETINFLDVSCVPNILVTFNYDIAQIPALAIPDIFESIIVAITFTPYNQTDNQFLDALDETLPTPLLRNTHIIGSIRRALRRKPPANFWSGLFGASRDFPVAETTILGPNPYDFFPRPNNTASLLLLQGIDIRKLRTMTDIQDPSLWTAVSNIGGMLTIGGVILSALFGLGYPALLGLEDFSLFPPSQKNMKAEGDEGSEKGHTRASAAESDGGGVEKGGSCQRNESDMEENTFLPLNRHNTV